jgi:hypothetical protein
MQPSTNSGGYGFLGGYPRQGNQMAPTGMGMQYGMMPQQTFQQRGPQTAPPDYQSPNFETNMQVLAQAAGKISKLTFT